MDPSVLLASASIDEATDNFLRKIQEVNPKLQTALVEKAFRFAFNAHQNQLRKSGEPFWLILWQLP
jgi:(p)ppGpp synthase/HD superfamily hydrolase